MFFLTILSLSGCKSYKASISGVETDKTTVSEHRNQLYQSFLTPPDSIRVGCYYYWVNEHVDPKGVKADLKWMKDNGITLAFLATDIRNRDRVDNPWEGQTFGKNKFQSKLWWKNLRAALKTAGELGIEIGIFNCPGWSQSGGPWVSPEEAMRNWTPGGIEICKTKEGTDVTCGPCSPEAEGLEVDKLSKTHVKKHFEAFFGEILRKLWSSFIKNFCVILFRPKSFVYIKCDVRVPRSISYIPQTIILRPACAYGLCQIRSSHVFSLVRSKTIRCPSSTEPHKSM